MQGMVRKPRIHFPGAFYHVIAHGNRREKIFRDKKDSQGTLNFLSEYKDRYGFSLYVYTLMPNHVLCGWVELKITVPPALHNKELAIVIEHEDIAQRVCVVNVNKSCYNYDRVKGPGFMIDRAFTRNNACLIYSVSSCWSKSSFLEKMIMYFYPCQTI